LFNGAIRSSGKLARNGYKMGTKGGKMSTKLLEEKERAVNDEKRGTYSARNPQCALVITPHREFEFALCS
jgi:hypothetical protein